MKFFAYWRHVLIRAWVRTWASVVERSPWAVFRDAVFVVIAAICVFAFRDVLSRLHAPLDVRASEWETGVWAAAGLISLVAVFVVFFLVELIFVTPYIIWRENLEKIATETDERSASNRFDEEFELRKRQVVAQEMHTAALREQVHQQEQDARRQEWQSLAKKFSKPALPLPNLPIREAFIEVCPTVISDDNYDQMMLIGDKLLDLLSTAQIHSWGRKISAHDKRDVSSLQSIDSSYWRGARWVFSFFGENRKKSDPHCWTPSNTPPRNDFADIHFDRNELLSHW